MKKLDTIKWLEKYFNESPIRLDNANNSLEFVWYWAIFENKCLIDSFENASYYSQLISISQLFPIKSFDYNSTYSYFYSRYWNKSKTTKVFKKLNFGKKQENKIISILKKSKPTESEKIQLLLWVIYRFRCNLFHGSKDPLLLYKFEEAFYYINKFLADFLDTKWSPTMNKKSDNKL